MKCDHMWCYIHQAYSGSGDSARVRRWCSECGREEVGIVRRWRRPRENEFDESAAEAAKDGQS